MTAKVLDIENDGDRLLCLGWCDKAYRAEAIPQRVLDELADPSIGKIVFTRYDHRWLDLHGFDVQGVVLDVQVMAWIVNERTDLDLESCAKRYCDVTMDKRITSRGGAPHFRRNDGEVVPLGEAPISQVCAYNEEDLSATQALFDELLRLIQREGLSDYYYNEALPLSQTLREVERRGLPVDVEANDALLATLTLEMEQLDDRLRMKADLPDDFNLGSHTLLRGLFYTPKSRHFEYERRLPHGEGASNWSLDREGRLWDYGTQRVRGLGLKRGGKTDNGAARTDSKTLRVHNGDDPWVEDYLALAQRRTVVNTFLSNFATMHKDGRIYGRFNQTGTKTGRLSSNGPNLQNVPARGELGKRVRELFRPAPGTVFVHGDYSQLEPRLMGHWSRDPVLIDIYNEGADIYLETARRVFSCSLEEAQQYRGPMKTYMLALGYGSGPATLRESLAINGYFIGLSEVEDTYEQLKGVYKRFFEWKNDVISDAENEGYVETLSGHRRRFGGTRRARSWREIGTDERQAVNAVIQGSAADIVARAMVRIEQEVPEVRLLAQVHDELLMESDDGAATPEVIARVQGICEDSAHYNLLVPLEFKPRKVANWAEGKD